MKIADLKVNPSTVGMTSSSSPKRTLLIVGYNVTIMYEDGTKTRKTVDVDTMMLPKSAYLGYAFGGSYFIVAHDQAYYVFTSSFEFVKKLSLDCGKIVTVEENHFGLLHENILTMYDNCGEEAERRELSAQEIAELG